MRVVAVVWLVLLLQACGTPSPPAAGGRTPEPAPPAAAKPGALERERDWREPWFVRTRVAFRLGASGFEQFWIGSNANKLISKSPCPVITLRAGIDAKSEMRIILMPVDSTLDTRQKVPFTAYLAQLFESEIYVLSIYASKYKSIQKRVDEYTDQVCTYLEDEGIKYHRDVLSCDNLTNGTIEYAKHIRANLISIMTEQETTPFNLLVGPYAQQMVNNSPYPVLSINPYETMQVLSR